MFMLILIICVGVVSVSLFGRTSDISSAIQLWFVSCAVLGAASHEMGAVMGRRRAGHIAKLIEKHSPGLHPILLRLTDAVPQNNEVRRELTKRATAGEAE